MMKPDPDSVELFVQTFLQSAKYRNYPILEETIRDVYIKELEKNSEVNEAQKKARKILHNITALYLGDPDYTKAIQDLRVLKSQNNMDKFMDKCLEIMSTHSSTRERLPYLIQIYESIFSLTGKPHSISDLACGLNPLSFLWMGLGSDLQYFAFDIYINRVNFLNDFFQLIGLKPNSEARDIIISLPDQTTDIALILKEVHRFEQRRKGISSDLINKIKSKFVVVSFPVQSLTSRHSLESSYRNLFLKLTSDHPWRMSEFIIGNELFFVINKNLN
jgi:16S rRNA (guanine(1405)-N(7))-methyltransferase